MSSIKLTRRVNPSRDSEVRNELMRELTMTCASANEARRTPWVMSSSVRSRRESIVAAGAPVGTSRCRVPGIAVTDWTGGANAAEVGGTKNGPSVVTAGVGGSDGVVVAALIAATGAGMVANAAETAAAAADCHVSSCSMISAQVPTNGIGLSASWNWLESKAGVKGCESSKIGGVNAVNSTVGGVSTRIANNGFVDWSQGVGRLRDASTHAALGGARRRRMPRPGPERDVEVTNDAGDGNDIGGVVIGTNAPSAPCSCLAR